MRIPERQRAGRFEERKEHGEREFPFTIYPCSIPVDFPRVPVHWHQEMEIIAVKKGRGIVTVDRKRYELRAGELLFVFPGQLHGINKRAGESGPMEYENIIFRPELLMSGGEDIRSDRFFLPLAEGRARVPFKVEEGTKEYEGFAACVRKLDELSGERGYGYQLGIKSCLFWLFYLAAGQQPEAGEERTDKVREKMRQILSYVEEHYGERISIEDAAAVCYYSPSHFMKYFKQYMGIPFVQYLNDYRLARAWARLEETEESVTNIAQSCGFENLSYFNRMFKRRYGMTPGQMRGLCTPGQMRGLPLGGHRYICYDKEQMPEPAGLQPGPGRGKGANEG